MTQEKVIKSTIQLQEELDQVKMLGEVFMHYVCSLGLEAVIEEKHLQKVHLTYLNTINQVSKL